MITTIIDPVKVSREDGQVTFPPSLLTSCKNLNGFIFFLLSNGRSEGTRTPNPRFWRPVLYQLSYTPPSYSTISVTTPEPTVLPPSRIANLTPLSIAIGAIISTSIAILSPGITISVPSGNEQTPVTSVVLK